MAAAIACFVAPGLARAEEPDASVGVVVQYVAPPECPSGDALATLVRVGLAGRKWDDAHPLQVRVTTSPAPRGYQATIAATSDAGPDLERTATAPTCEEVTEVAAEIIALAQSERPPPVAVQQVPGSAPPPPKEALPSAPMLAVSAAPELGDFAYSFTLGYGAFTAGPADPIIWAGPEKTTFNPAQGVRLGFDVTRAAGWWKHSLHVSAAYYRQGTTTVQEPSYPSTQNRDAQTPMSLSDRGVLLATIDACPIHLDHAFVSLIPCATFSMMQTQGNSGSDPQLETGLGGSVHLRAHWKQYFAEGACTIVAASDLAEPPSRPYRIFNSLSLGITIR